MRRRWREKGKWGGEAQREVLVGETQYIDRDEGRGVFGPLQGKWAAECIITARITAGLHYRIITTCQYYFSCSTIIIYIFSL